MRRLAHRAAAVIAGPFLLTACQSDSGAPAEPQILAFSYVFLATGAPGGGGVDTRNIRDDLRSGAIDMDDLFERRDACSVLASFEPLTDDEDDLPELQLFGRDERNFPGAYQILDVPLFNVASENDCALRAGADGGRSIDPAHLASGVDINSDLNLVVGQAQDGLEAVVYLSGTAFSSRNNYLRLEAATFRPATRYMTGSFEFTASSSDPGDQRVIAVRGTFAMTGRFQTG